MNNLNYKTQERLLAIQLLYSYRLNPNNFLVAKVFDSKANNVFESNVDYKYSDLLFNGVKIEKSNVDQTLKNCLIGTWTIDKLDLIIKIIFELAIYELSFIGDLPAKIILDDYVSLTKSFYSQEKEIGFANAVLHKIASKIRPDEII